MNVKGEKDAQEKTCSQPLVCVNFSRELLAGTVAHTCNSSTREGEDQEIKVIFSYKVSLKSRQRLIDLCESEAYRCT